MSDWSGFPFLILWGIIAVFLGLVFATSPDLMESIYRERVNRTRLTKRLAAQHAPQEGVIKLYRVGGVVFIVLGVAGLIAGIVGTVGFATGVFS